MLPEDLLAQEELVKDRVRLLLDRYGLVCRELLTRELPVMGNGGRSFDPCA